jgi:hypothetical protein
VFDSIVHQFLQKIDFSGKNTRGKKSHEITIGDDCAFKKSGFSRGVTAEDPQLSWNSTFYLDQ